MSQIDLIDNKWADLMFENRNKEYGAYVLRRQTTSRNIKSIIIVLILFALVMAYMLAMNAYMTADVEATSFCVATATCGPCCTCATPSM